MAHGKFEFIGKGSQYLWLLIWTTVLTILTVGIFGPWAIAAQIRWLVSHIKIDGKQLCFKGSGGGYFANWLLMMFLTIITLGIYLPWGIVRLVRWIVSNTYFADPGDVEYLVDIKEAKKNNVLYCLHCGAQLLPDTLFCEQCGTKVEK
jgi:uncharacterized membrane protein YjgN (DUF898 family)/ribosomal protein L40E